MTAPGRVPSAWSRACLSGCASGSAACAGRVEMTTSAAARRRAASVLEAESAGFQVRVSMSSPMRWAALSARPGPACRRATTVIRPARSSPSAARAEQAVAPDPSTTACSIRRRPSEEPGVWVRAASLSAPTIPATSVLKPVRSASPAPLRCATTVLTAPTASARGSMTSRCARRTCLRGMVTLRPAQAGPA